MLRPLAFACVLGTGTLLAGCGGGDTVAEALGMAKDAPDEFAVIKRKPLIIPPDYALRPPRPGEVADERTSRAEALAVLSGEAATAAPASTAATAGEQELLTRAQSPSPAPSTVAASAPTGVTQGSVAPGDAEPAVQDDLLEKVITYDDTTVPGDDGRPTVTRRDQSPIGSLTE